MRELTDYYIDSYDEYGNEACSQADVIYAADKFTESVSEFFHGERPFLYEIQCDILSEFCVVLVYQGLGLIVDFLCKCGISLFSYPCFCNVVICSLKLIGKFC